MVMKISTKGIKPKYVHWMSLQAKCHRCGCTQPPSTFGWWLVACKSKQGIWEKNFENFLFRIFKTRFQSFLKSFWNFEKLFFEFSKKKLKFYKNFHFVQWDPSYGCHWTKSKFAKFSKKVFQNIKFF